MPDLKFTTLAEATDYVNAHRAQLDAAVDKGVTIPTLSAFDRWGISKRFNLAIVILIGLGLAVVIVAGALFEPLDASRTFFAVSIVLFIWAGFILGLTLGLIAYFSQRRRKIKQSIQLDVSKIYQEFFRGLFDNLVVSGMVDDKKASELVHRSSKLPPLSWISEFNAGVYGTIDGLPFSTYWVKWKAIKWKWYLNTLSIKSYSVIGAEVRGANSRYENFQMEMTYPSWSLNVVGGMRKSSAKMANEFRDAPQLENTTFEKHVIVSANDQVALRRQLTPRTQEEIIDRMSASTPLTEVSLSNNLFHMIQNENHECFLVNLGYSLKRKQIMIDYKKDLAADIAHFLTFISQLTDYETFTRG